MARKIAIAIHKGGVGKTTTATNLAAATALAGWRTLLVDLDEQANATKGLGFDPSSLPGTLYHLFAEADRHVQTAIFETEIPNLHLLPGHPDLAQTEKGMTVQRSDPNAPDPIQALKQLLESLDAAYDFIFFDTPPSLNYMTINALAAADDVLIPAAASAYTEDGVARTWKAYERAKASYNPTLRRPRIVVTRVKRTNASGEVRLGMGEAFGTDILPQLIFESTKVDEAAQVRKPVVLYDPSGSAATGYRQIAKLLIEELQGNE